MAAHWELALRLRERRERLGLDIHRIAADLDISPADWEAVEEQRTAPSEPDLTRALDLLEVSAPERHQLLDLRTTALQSGWWDDYSALFDADIKRFYGLEASADFLCYYDSLLVPGLLQTPDYIRAVMSTDSLIPNVEVEARVLARLRRQQRLHNDEALCAQFVFSEAALRQQIGGRNVLRGQLEHLLALTEHPHPNLDIRVIPFTAPACNLFGSGSVGLLDFRNPRLPRAAWHETVTEWGIITNAEKTHDISDAFVEAVSRAATPEHTRTLVEQCRVMVA